MVYLEMGKGGGGGTTAVRRSEGMNLSVKSQQSCSVTTRTAHVIFNDTFPLNW